MSGEVTLDVFDVAGRHVGRVIRHDARIGWNSIDIGESEPVRLERSGVYFYRLTSSDARVAGKFTIVR